LEIFFCEAWGRFLWRGLKFWGLKLCFKAEGFSLLKVWRFFGAVRQGS
jgi:hypothetical protein